MLVSVTLCMKLDGQVIVVMLWERPFQYLAALGKNEAENVLVWVRGRATCSAWPVYYMRAARIMYGWRMIKWRGKESMKGELQCSGKKTKLIPGMKP